MLSNSMVVDIDQELESIIIKYNLDRHYPVYRTSRQACAYLRKWIENLSETDTKILFITIDNSVMWMIRGWAIRENIDVIRISSVEDLDNYISGLQNVEKVYIAAYTRTVEILHWLWRHDFQGESVYDVLENQGIYCQMEFYRFFPPFVLSDELGLDSMCEEINTDGTALTLYEHYYQKKRLQHCDWVEDKKRLNEKLFFLAICMRNFVEAERILRTMPYSDEYEKCWREIETLLDKIKRILTQNKQHHIIIYWIDGLSYEDAEKLHYLQEQRRYSLYFHNAFTLTPYTIPTFKTMFFGIKQVDDLGYQINRLELNNSPLLQDIEEMGYDLKIISNYINRRLSLKNNCNCYGQQISYAPCSEPFWSLIKQIIQTGQPTVYLSHALVELHPPRLSVRREGYERKYGTKPETWRVQLEELDEQLCFYDRMIGDSSYRIYMGDHGVRGVAMNKLHVGFQIYHAKWKNREVDKLFCPLDFPPIIHQLMAGKEIDDTVWNREYVPIQDVDYYNPIRLKSLLIRHPLDVLRSSRAYKGVVTTEYIYVYFRNGDEIFHKWSNGRYVPTLGFNNSQEDLAIVNELRKKVGTFPKELDIDSKFEYSKNTDVILENVKRTVLEAARLLNEKIAKYADNSIVLRPGGYHTIQLYEIISVDNRKKIGGIVDRNPNCMGSDLGYPVYTSEKKLPENIKAVLLSTFENLNELKYEADKQYSDMEIIDVYQYWEKCGYAFRDDFWCGLDTDLDVELL